MIGTIAVVILFILVVSACCCSNSNSSSNSTTTPKRTGTTNYQRTNHYNHYSYCECPSCGAPYFDGYCEECGYPDVNQGWLGEQY